MFIWNMIGAVVLIPALSYFLLPSRIVAHQDEHVRHVASPAA
jgi:hypothetical protein